ncbi:MAG: MFS transporter [Gemmatimonadales bacterium]|nr:MFS transporter [Gemmatimonadales bacterium]MDZ4389322.1 MFS transporter [Gemmatimonadales bacterium]
MQRTFASSRLALAGVKRALAGGPLHALRHRDFRMFATGQTVSLIGTWMQIIAQGWLVLTLTGSAFDVGLVTTLGTLPILLFTLYGGVVADKVDKRRFILALQSVMMLEAIALAALTLTGHVTVHMIWGLALLHGLATAFEVPTRQSFLVDLVPPEDVVSAAALNSTIYNLSRVIGPGIAGIVLAVGGPGACFSINAVSYTAVLIGLSRIRKRSVPRVVAGKPSVFAGLQFIRSQPVLAQLTMQMVLVSVFAVSFVPILPVFAREVLGTGATGYGALTSSVGVGAALGAIVIGGLGRRVRRTRSAVVGALSLGVVVMAVSFTRQLPLAMFCLALAGASMAGVGIATATSLQLASPPELRGRVMAVYSFVVLGLAPISAFQAGWLAEHFGVPLSVGVNGAVTLAGTLVLARRLWHGSES